MDCEQEFNFSDIAKHKKLMTQKKKDRYEPKDGTSQVKIIGFSPKQKRGQANCCSRKAHKVLAFIHKTKGGLRITKMQAICRSHWVLLQKLFMKE
jgi:hypothetical protein